MDKYDVMKMLEEFVSEDEQCSRSCRGCRYEKVCDRINEEDVLERLFKAK